MVWVHCDRRKSSVAALVATAIMVPIEITRLGVQFFPLPFGAKLSAHSEVVSEAVASDVRQICGSFGALNRCGALKESFVKRR